MIGSQKLSKYRKIILLCPQQSEQEVWIHKWKDYLSIHVKDGLEKGTTRGRQTVRKLYDAPGKSWKGPEPGKWP